MSKAFESIGVLDSPATEDGLKIQRYIGALAGFIQKCPTPMTVAVQGDWGSGKTSAMKLAAGVLRAEDGFPVHIVEFNTWQYSQFDLGESLALSLLERIIMELPESKGEASSQRVRQSLRVLKAALFRAGMTAVEFAPGGKIAAEAVAAGAQAMQADVPDDEPSPIELLSQLRGQFEKAVAASGKRLVVFVDDLDRLDPQRAVELMEAIKVFLDVENCVFVLAIDFDVVRRGVNFKYRDENLSEDKARSFFDKIIQVPFQLPVSLYQTDQLFENGLRAAGVKTGDWTQFKEFSERSIGSNPRATKRLLNTFALLQLVKQSESAADSDIDLFALLCLQTAFPEFYNRIVAAEKNEYHEVLCQLIDGLSPDDEENSSPISGAAPRELLEAIQAHFSSGKGIDSARFMSAVEHTAVTSVGTQSRVRQGRRAIVDPADRQKHLAQKGIPDGLIQIGASLEAALKNSYTFDGQTDASWTMRSVGAQRRAGRLLFKKSALSLTLEWRKSDEGSYSMLEDEAKLWASKHGVSTGTNGGARLETDPYKEGRSTAIVRLHWSPADNLQSEAIAQLVTRLQPGFSH